jgi:hypothetical protein
MAGDARQRQRKLEKRATKRSAKKDLQRRAKAEGLTGRLVEAAHFPVLHCWAGESLWREGQGWIVLSRQVPNGVAVANFLIDRYCLGVKDAAAVIVPAATYDSRVVRRMRSERPCRDLSPATARKFVERAVAYAEKLGFAPHAGYEKAKALFGSINVAESTDELEFGKDGKPFYISSPNVPLWKSKQIVATLARTCGDGNFHYLVPLAEEDLPPGVRVVSAHNLESLSKPDANTEAEHLLDVSRE